MAQSPNSLSGVYYSPAGPAQDSPVVMPRESAGIIHLNTALRIYVAIEFLAVACSAYIASKVYHEFVLGSSELNDAYVLAAIVIAALVLFTSLGLHSFVAIRRQSRYGFVWKGIGATIFALSLFLTIIFFMHLAEDYSRGTFIFQAIFVSFVLAGTRSIFYSWLHSSIATKRIEARRVILIGQSDKCIEFSERLSATGIRTVCSFRLPHHHDIKRASKIDSKIGKIVAACRSLKTDDVIILSSQDDLPKMFDVASSFAELPAGVHVVPIDALGTLASSQIIKFGNLQTIQVYRPPLSTSERFIKRLFDITFASVGLVIFSPLFLIVAIAIKLGSAGPVFFRQKRHGFNNNEIRVFKFRSMTITEDGDRFTEAVKNDRRVTRIGRILRLTNIDELPQLINVILGEMSLVGPRPHAIAQSIIFQSMVAPFSRRHNVKPGITGWAQVNGYRGVTDTLDKLQRRIEYDLYYVDNWSLLFDIKIIIMTLFTKKAYFNAY